MRSASKIKAGIRCCLEFNGACRDCPYNDGELRCMIELTRDVIAAIKDQAEDNTSQEDERPDERNQTC